MTGNQRPPTCCHLLPGPVSCRQLRGAGMLRAGPAAMPPEVRLQAAALLAFKCKQQLVQLQPVERQLELVEALTALAADGQLGEQPDMTQRALCVALANLAIHCTAWSRPLDMLGEQAAADPSGGAP